MSDNIIKLLDEVTISLIAAGEVVESPASIVKELIENAIDAMATNIIIEIKDGGKTYIRITDDGLGIEEAFVELAFQRHTTSKINSFNDFCNLSTNGFRGEALASIAAVSKVSIITKPKDSFLGTSLEIIGGQVTKRTKVGTKDGSTIIVEDLLFNTPARKNFLKSNQAETMRINEVIEKLALINKNVKFKYINNNKVMLTTTGNDTFSGALNNIYKNIYNNSVKEITLEYIDDYGIEGFLGDNSIMSHTRKNQYIYVNNRVIKSMLITSAVEQAYKEFITVNRFPVFLINLNIDQALIDVNIHPSKLEVKFTDENKVKDIIFTHIKNKLSKSIMIPKSNLSIKIQSDNNKEYTKITLEDYYKSKSAETHNNLETNDIIQDKPSYIENILINETIEPSYIDIQNTKIDSNDSLVISLPREMINHENIFNYKDLEIIGVFIQSYIITQHGDTLFLIDQHAAHERILYEKYINSFIKSSSSSQDLLLPIPISLSFDMTVYINDIVEMLIDYGFVTELLSDDSIVLRSIPTIFTQNEALNLAYELINNYNSNNNITDELKDKMATKACKAAIKAHDNLYTVEISKLLSDLDNCKNKYACPHGRPITIQITKFEMEKMFKRIV